MNHRSIVGHEEVRRVLRAAAEGGQLPHALVVSGPVGIGKSLVARELSALLLCSAGRDRPCGDCASCVQVAAGTHPDSTTVSLLAGKKEISVDLIRQLKRMIALRAVAGACKVAVIEDAERLSIAAQNALLKTLEEPPLGSFLILVTSSVQSLLSTVRSRCRQMTLRPLSIDEVKTVLGDIVQIAPEEADELAQLAEGSPGYALQLRDALASWSGDGIDQLLADLNPDRYVSVVRLAKVLGRTEQEMVTRLQMLYARLHATAVTALRSDREVEAEATPVELERVSRQAAAVASFIFLLQRSNPNRPLLAEAAALSLARS